MSLNKDLEHVMAEAIRKMPDAQIMKLIRAQLDDDTVPKPEPRRKGRKMRKAVPAKTKGRKPKKPEMTESGARALKAVQRARSPQTIQDLAKKLKLRPDTLRPLLKKLAENGLIEMTGEGNGEKRVHRWLFSAK